MARYAPRLSQDGTTAHTDRLEAYWLYLEQSTKDVKNTINKIEQTKKNITTLFDWRSFHIKSDSFARQGLHEDLHSTTKAKDQMECGLFLDVVVRQRASARTTHM